MGKTVAQITVMGVVVPVEWDDEGHPKAFAIFTYDEQEYLIDSCCLQGKALIAMPQQKIRVTGILGEAVNNRRLLKVIDFERMSSAAPDSKRPVHRG